MKVRKVFKNWEVFYFGLKQASCGISNFNGQEQASLVPALWFAALNNKLINMEVRKLLFCALKSAFYGVKIG